MLAIIRIKLQRKPNHVGLFWLKEGRAGNTASNCYIHNVYHFLLLEALGSKQFLATASLVMPLQAFLGSYVARDVMA